MLGIDMFVCIVLGREFLLSMIMDLLLRLVVIVWYGSLR